MARQRRSPRPVEQRLGFLEVGRVEPLVEPLVDRGEDATDPGSLTIGDEPGQAHRGPQLPRPGALPAGHRAGLAELRLRLRRAAVAAEQEQLAPEADQLGLAPALPGPLRPGEAALKQAPPARGPPRAGARLGEQ